MIHEIQVKDRMIDILFNRDIVQNGIEADELFIHFDYEWNNLDRIEVVFANGSILKRVIAQNGEIILFPYEVLTSEGKLYITLLGYKDNKVRVITQKMEEPFRVVPSGVDQSYL